MFQAKLIATASKKSDKENSATLEVMEMRHRVKDNVLWINDHRGHAMDFDLDEFDVEIKTMQQCE